MPVTHVLSAWPGIAYYGGTAGTVVFSLIASVAGGDAPGINHVAGGGLAVTALLAAAGLARQALDARLTVRLRELDIRLREFNQLEAEAKGRRLAEREFLNDQMLLLRADRDQFRDEATALRSAILANSGALHELGSAVDHPVTPAVLAPTSPNLAALPAPVVGGEGRRPRILIVDDSPTACESLARLFHRAGWDPTTVADGLEASRSMHSGVREPFDVYFVDLLLPDQSGVGVIDIARRSGLKSPRTGEPVRIIAYTGLDGSDDLVRAAVAAGVDAIVFKLTNPDQVLAVAAGSDPGCVPVPPRSFLS